VQLRVHDGREAQEVTGVKKTIGDLRVHAFRPRTIVTGSSLAAGERECADAHSYERGGLYENVRASFNGPVSDEARTMRLPLAERCDG